MAAATGLLKIFVFIEHVFILTLDCIFSWLHESCITNLAVHCIFWQLRIPFRADKWVHNINSQAPHLLCQTYRKVVILFRLLPYLNISATYLFVHCILCQMAVNKATVQGWQTFRTPKSLLYWIFSWRCLSTLPSIIFPSFCLYKLY